MGRHPLRWREGASNEISELLEFDRLYQRDAHSDVIKSSHSKEIQILHRAF